MGPLEIGLALAATIGSVAFCLVVLPYILEKRGDLPYNSVESRIVVWSAFAALMASVAIFAAGGLSWDPLTWALLFGLIAFAAFWDIRDLKLRRMPRGRHPER